MDAAVQQKLLEDPAVSAAIRQAGKDALSDPSVQQLILDTCKEKFPLVAAQAKDTIILWANDPEVQKQAYAYAGVAMDYAYKSVNEVKGLIEQGPAGIRVLAFAGGVAGLVKCVFVLLGMLNPIDAAANIAPYVVHGYQAIFATSTILFEAKPEWIARVPGLNEYQDMLIDKAKFLSETLGRGLFYGFQATLWLSFASFTNLAEFGLGVWFLFIAVLHLGMHFHIIPYESNAKVQSVRQMVSVQSPRAEKAPKVEEAPPQTSVTSGLKALFGGLTKSATGPTESPKADEERPLLPEDKKTEAPKAQEPAGAATPVTQTIIEPTPKATGKNAVQPANKGGCCTLQ
jgi:hypothetical protein